MSSISAKRALFFDCWYAKFPSIDPRWFPQSDQVLDRRIGTMVNHLPFLRYVVNSDSYLLDDKYLSKPEFQNAYLKCPICVKEGTQPMWPFWRCQTCRNTVCSQHMQTLNMKKMEGDCAVCGVRLKEIRKRKAADDISIKESKKPKMSRDRDPNEFPNSPWNIRCNLRCAVQHRQR